MELTAVYRIAHSRSDRTLLDLIVHSSCDNLRLHLCGVEMRPPALAVFASAIVLLGDLGSLQAQEQATDQWQELTTDLSRGDLFETILAARQAEDPTTFAFPNTFVFPRHTTYDEKLKKNRTDVIFGADVSHHNGGGLRFDQTKRQNVQFVYVKATQGIGYKDGRFAENWSALGSLRPQSRMARGAYHFLSASGDGGQQALSFWNLLVADDGLKPGDLPPVVDLEWDKASRDGPDRWAERSPDEIMASLMAWLNTIEERRSKRVPMIYTARSWWRERVGSEARFAELAKYKIWIATTQSLAKHSRSHTSLIIAAGIFGNSRRGLA